MTRQIGLLGLPYAIEQDCLRYSALSPRKGVSLHPVSLEALAQIAPASLDKLAYLATPELHVMVMQWAQGSTLAMRPQLLALVPARGEAPHPPSPRIEALMSLPSPIHTLMQQLLRLPQSADARPITEHLVLCPQRKALADPSGTQAIVALTDKEFMLLAALIDAAPHPIDRATLMQHIWGHDQPLDTHTLETHVYRLRGKLAKRSEQSLIHTDEQGYRFGV